MSMTETDTKVVYTDTDDLKRVKTDYIIDADLMSEYKDKIYREVRRLHEAINDFYSYTEPHTKIESDLFLSMEDIYKDIVDVIRKGDQKIVDTIQNNQ